MPCVSFVDAVKVELKGLCALLVHIPSVGGPVLSLSALLLLSKFKVLIMSEGSTAYSSPLISKRDFVSTLVAFRRRVSLFEGVSI